MLRKNAHNLATGNVPHLHARVSAGTDKRVFVQLDGVHGGFVPLQPAERLACVSVPNPHAHVLGAGSDPSWVHLDIEDAVCVAVEFADDTPVSRVPVEDLAVGRPREQDIVTASHEKVRGRAP